ncbi:MAG TPA: hypothetical protein VGK89_10895 [Candidatus Eisenbacteria bacterium]|jgi:hypothetical protein
MADWQELRPEALRDWIATHTRSKAPPIFRLRAPERAKAQEEWRRVLDATGRRRGRSGILEIDLGPLTLETDISYSMDMLHEVGSLEDPRSFHEVREPDSHAFLAQSESSLPEVGLPVIGPGGRITVTARGSQAAADIVVRRREEKVASGWRSTADLIEAVRRRFSVRPPGEKIVEMYGAFGYFELSKYERQDWLRPAVVLSLKIAFAEDERIEWGDSIVEPVTVAENLAPREGLGDTNEE